MPKHNLIKGSIAGLAFIQFLLLASLCVLFNLRQMLDPLSPYSFLFSFGRGEEGIRPSGNWCWRQLQSHSQRLLWTAHFTHPFTSGSPSLPFLQVLCLQLFNEHDV